MIYIFTCRPENLPWGFYVPNGDKFDSDSPQGLALLALDEDIRTDWGIAESGGEVNLPDFFDADGYPYFPRPVDGTSRLPGSVQGDAIRNIAGNDSTARDRRKSGTGNIWSITGPYAINVIEYENRSVQTGTASTHDYVNIKFDASLAVPTANENRPKNIGLTYAMFLNA
jgi:hypothetical protein